MKRCPTDGVAERRVAGLKSKRTVNCLSTGSSNSADEWSSAVNFGDTKEAIKWEAAQKRATLGHPDAEMASLES